MGAEISIATWTNRTSSSMANSTTVDRIEKITKDLATRTLQDALNHPDFPPNAYFCFKEVSVAFGFDEGVSLRSQSRSWAESLRERLLKLVVGETDFVRFDSLTQAHQRCAEAVVQNDGSLAWAWRQMDVLRIPDRTGPNQMLDLWCNDSERRGIYQISVWRHLLRSSLLPLVVMRFCTEHWKAHMRGLTSTLNYPVTKIAETVALEWRAASLQERSGGKHDPNLHSVSGAPVVLSELLGIPMLFQCLGKCDQQTAGRLLTIAMIVTEPGLVEIDASPRKVRINTIVSAVVRRLNLLPGRGEDISRAHSEYTSDKKNIEHNKHEQFKSIFDGSEPSQQRTKKRNANLEVLTEPGTQLSTPYGGIFFLYNVMSERLVSEQRLLTHRLFAQLPAQWIWYWLARQILPPENFQSAAMAFAGLEHDDQWIEITDHEPDAAQQNRLTEVADDIKHKTLLRLREAGAESAQTLDALLRRRAHINLDGPWLRVIYALSEVDVDIRRAGLDANPGYISWLGKVVVFNYE